MFSPRFQTPLCAALLFAACSSSTTADTSAPAAAPLAPASTDVYPQEPFRQAQPAAAVPRPFQLPAVQNFQLANGIDVYLIEKHDLPVISATLSFEGGETNDPQRKLGRADVCVQMLSEGTKKLDKIAFNEALADIASDVSSRAGSDTQTVSFRSLSKNLDSTFGLFADTIRTPGLRKADFDRLIQQNLEGLKQAKGSVTSVSRRVADSVLYGAKHPLGHVVTEKTLSSLRISDCKRYHRDYIKPQGAKLFVVGDMNQAQVREKFEAGLAGWKGKSKASVAMTEPKSRDGKVFFIDVPGAAQSAIRVMHFGPTRKATDYFANTMMSAVFGGGFSGRINMNLREAKGYSYGARGTFGYNRQYGTFVASSSVRSDATYQSVLEVLGEMEGIKSGQKSVTTAELQREQNGAILGLPARFSTSRQALGMYRDLVYHGLPLSYYNGYVDSMSQVSLEQANASAQAHIQPQAAIVLVVGDANAPMIQRVSDGTDRPLLDGGGKQITLREALQGLAKSGRLGAGELVVLDADGVAAK